ncbi:hypothetical protein F4813DRAFT_220465 [Daldinia decipiens]|uniref:uncharacterized protein n=1 Tax=Daldinia decipiens TaxID=326647 RepID=UPI0020C20A0F|nr:uncharacterized protein F4813DRAFT_220465 [Daldinia decipiens]KAI1661188.1 hypothetical protein F4813DRAFT_220465 [Daldinia decipiens]
MNPIIMPSYSTLEVHMVESYGPYDYETTNKEAVRHSNGIYLQPAPFEVEGSGAYFPEVVNYEGEQPPSDTTAVDKPQSPASLICGLSKRIFYIVFAVGLVVVIGAIVGGVVGGISGGQHHTSKQSNDSQQGPSGIPNANSTSSSSSNQNVLKISKLVSSNMTDENGYVHRFVFFQDTYNAIIERRWDSQNRTWITSNITEIMRGSTTPVNPLPGAPLAVASCNYNTVFETHLWFTVPDSYVSAVYLRHADTKPDNWQYDTLYTGALQTYPGSQLAATWQRCWSEYCIGNWVLAYQTPGGDVNVANATHWDNPTRVIGGRDVAANSSLGIISQLNGLGTNRLALISETVGSQTSSSMQKTMYLNEWEPDGLLIEDLPPPSPNLQFAVLLMENFTQTMFLTLRPNGTVSALWWGGHFTSIPSVDFRGGPSTVNFTAISAGEDSMLYGISGDEVLQYEPDPLDLFGFTYVSRVYP